MKYYTIQITNGKNLVIKEQKANPESPDFYKKLFGSVGLIEHDVTIQFKVPVEVKEAELRLSRATGRYDWEDKVNVIETYNTLSSQQKERLLLLSMYTPSQIIAITGWTLDCISKQRERLYLRIDAGGQKAHHTQKDLLEFCKALQAAGIDLPVWNAEMD